MANGDTSAYTLRWNEIAKDLEYSSGINWFPTGVGLVDGINQLTGDVTAGPGTGSVAATVVSAGGGTGSFHAGELYASGLTGTAQPFIFIPTVDSTTAFEFKSQSLTPPVLTVDTIDGNVGINTSTPNRSLQVVGNAGVSADFIASTIHINGGFFFLEGVYTAAQIVAVPSPVLGEMSVASDTGAFYYYNGSAWVTVYPTTPPSPLATVSLTHVAANISTTTLFTPTSTGLYSINVYTVCTTGDAAAGSANLNITYTDDSGSQSLTPFNTQPLATTGVNATSYQPIELVSGHPIQYSTSVSGTYGSAQYSLYITLTQLH